MEGNGDEGDEEMRARLAKYLQTKKRPDVENPSLVKKSVALKKSRNNDAIPITTIQAIADRVKRPWGSVSSIADTRNAKVLKAAEGQGKPSSNSYPNLNSNGAVRPNRLDRLRRNILYQRVHQDPSFKPLVDSNSTSIAYLENLTPKQILQHRSATEELAVNLHDLFDTIEGKMGRLLGYHNQVIKEKRPVIPGIAIDALVQ